MAELTEVVTEAQAEALIEAGIESREDLADATVEELVKIDGIGEATAKKLIKAAQGADDDSDSTVEIKAEDLAGLVPGRIVHFKSPVNNSVEAGVVVEVVDSEKGVCHLFVFCHPRFSPRALPYRFMHDVPFGGTEGPKDGHWTWGELDEE